MALLLPIGGPEGTDHYRFVRRGGRELVPMDRIEQAVLLDSSDCTIRAWLPGTFRWGAFRIPLDGRARFPRTRRVSKMRFGVRYSGRNPKLGFGAVRHGSLPMARRIARDDASARDALQESWIIVLDSIEVNLPPVGG